MRRGRLELWIAGLIVIVDQATKALVRAEFDLSQSMTIVPGFLDLTSYSIETHAISIHGEISPRLYRYRETTIEAPKVGSQVS